MPPRKKERFELRLTDSQKSRYQEASDRLGISLAKWLLKCAEEALVEKEQPSMPKVSPIEKAKADLAKLVEKSEDSYTGETGVFMGRKVYYLSSGKTTFNPPRG